MSYLLGSSGRLLPNNHSRLSPNHFSIQDATLFHSLLREQSHTKLSFIRVSERKTREHIPPKFMSKFAPVSQMTDIIFFNLIRARVFVTRAAELLVVVVEIIDPCFVYSLCRPVYMTTAVVGRNVG